MSEQKSVTRRRWTREEEEYLCEKWGTVSVQTISKKLDRTPNSIMVRVQRLGLPPFYESGEYVTLNQVCKALRGCSVNSYQQKSWVVNRGLPVHKKLRNKYSCKVVYLEEFWEWAEKHRSFLDFSRLEPLALGEEPAWVAEQRHKDFRANALQKKTPWTSDEDSRLKAMLKQQKFGYAEMSKILNRSAGAIQRRCTDLGIKERPVKADNHGDAAKWTDSMYETLADGIRNGDSYSLIGERIGKSEKAVRGKVYSVYLTENADKIRAMIGNGAWGFGTPTPTVRQAIHLSGQRVEVKAQLSALAGVLRYQMNKLGYDPYWQRYMCMNWDDIQGCMASKENCDTCADFRRIQPQYCARCGGTFYERKETRFCADCRIARKKKAQRHWQRVNSYSKNSF